MSNYTVTAIDPVTGQSHVERVQATNEDLARTSLASRGLNVVDARKVGLELNGDLPFMKARVKPRDLAVFTRQWATMISSGLPMLRALGILVKQTQNTTLREVLMTVQTDIEAGARVSDAIGKHDKVFPPLIVSMLRAGEAGGNLDGALSEIATSIEKEVKLRRQIIAAATYPVVVLILALLGTIAMLIWVVPAMTSMYNGLGGELPLMTRVVVAMSDFMKIAALPLLGVVIIFMFWWQANKNTPQVRNVVDPIKLRLPVFGTLIRKIALARFTRNLSVMLAAGVPILTALRIVANTAGNAVVTNAVLDAAAKVETGGNLSQHLGTGGVVPDMVVQMVAVGEESGAMDRMLAKAADFYDEEVEATTSQLASLLEPILIVIVALVLGSLVIAMYLPTFSVFDLINKQ